LATAIILLYESSLQIIGYLAGLLLSIIVNHNPDFKNQFEQFQNIIPQRRPIIITTTMQSMKVTVRMIVLVNHQW